MRRGVTWWNLSFWHIARVPITQEWEVFKRGQRSAKQRWSCLTRFNEFQLLPSRWPHYSACKSALGEGAAADGWSRPSMTIKCQKANLFGNPYYRNSPHTVCLLLILSGWLTSSLTSNLCLLLKINPQQTIHIDLSISRPPHVWGALQARSRQQSNVRRNFTKVTVTVAIALELTVRAVLQSQDPTWGKVVPHAAECTYNMRGLLHYLCCSQNRFIATFPIVQ